MDDMTLLRMFARKRITLNEVAQYAHIPLKDTLTILREAVARMKFLLALSSAFVVVNADTVLRGNKVGFARGVLLVTKQC